MESDRALPTRDHGRHRSRYGIFRDIPSQTFAYSTVPELFRLDQAYVGDSHVALVSLSKHLAHVVSSCTFLTCLSLRAALYLSTVVFTFGTLGMLTPAVHKASDRPGDAQPLGNILHRLLAEMDKGGTVSLAVFWLSSVVISVSHVHYHVDRCSDEPYRLSSSLCAIGVVSTYLPGLSRLF